MLTWVGFQVSSFTVLVLPSGEFLSLFIFPCLVEFPFFSMVNSPLPRKRKRPESSASGLSSAPLVSVANDHTTLFSGSRPFTEVKQRRARFVLGWVSA